MKTEKLSGRKLFVELFLKYEADNLSKAEIARTKREGVKNITDGKFWLKICKEYSKINNLRP